MFLTTQRNKPFSELMRLGLNSSDFEESYGASWYSLAVKNNFKLRFTVTQNDERQPRDYTISRLPGYDSTRDIEAISLDDGWENGSHGIWPKFRAWAAAVKREIQAPDL